MAVIQFWGQQAGITSCFQENVGDKQEMGGDWR